MERKIIQIITEEDRLKNIQMKVLCNDGTIWIQFFSDARDDCYWKQQKLPKIPQN